jgi:Lsr2
MEKILTATRVAVSATIPQDILPGAALGLGVSLHSTPRTDLVKAALALFQGKSRDEARELIDSRKYQLGGDGPQYVVARVPQELADTGNAERAYAIRVGLLMAGGLSRREAETWARMTRGRTPGPVKEVPESLARNRAIRAWAASHGIRIGSRGSIPQSVIDAYDRDQETPAQQAG